MTIVIPCFNDWKYIEQAVDSALNQTYINKEIIVVDDGSDHRTRLKLSQLEPKISKLITQSNFGQSNARNRGIYEAKGVYILVLDSDDFFEPKFCEMAVEEFEKSENIKIVTCYGNRIFESNGSKDIIKPTGGNITDFVQYNRSFGSCMFKKSDWVLVGGYDENMTQGFEDWEFFIRILNSGGKCFVIPEILFNYRVRNNSTTTRAYDKRYELWKYIILKNEELFKQHFEVLVNHFLFTMHREDNEKLKLSQSMGLKIGNFILFPFYKLKRFFNHLRAS
ncbi:glycosyltransferase family 2 protein [Flavobacteriaceae bacterium]|nr:glycosyltransferase family 2 protein [Flavobacteriaceae bacterium]